MQAVLAALLALGAAACAGPRPDPVVIDGRRYQMKESCERCGAPIGFDDEAAVCPREDTFCARCAHALADGCPSCGAALAPRPGRGTLKPRPTDA
jgi:hypothetical protein